MVGPQINNADRWEKQTPEEWTAKDDSETGTDCITTIGAVNLSADGSMGLMLDCYLAGPTFPAAPTAEDNAPGKIRLIARFQFASGVAAT